MVDKILSVMKTLSPKISVYRKSVKLEVKAWITKYPPSIFINFYPPEEGNQQNNNNFGGVKYNYKNGLGFKLNDNEVFKIIDWFNNGTDGNLEFIHKIKNQRNNYITSITFSKFITKQNITAYSIFVTKNDNLINQQIKRKVVLSRDEFLRIIIFMKFYIILGYLTTEIYSQLERINNNSSDNNFGFTNDDKFESF